MTRRTDVKRSCDLPLTKLEHDRQLDSLPLFKVICRECGDVTGLEGGGSVATPVSVRLGQATIYRQRHLAAHLAALSAELTEAVR